MVNPGQFPIWTTLALGFILGLRHALDPDHLAAVSTFVSEERKPLRSTLIGMFWGLGHTAALLVFGLALAAFRLETPPRVAQFFEFAVGCMLVVLGVRALRGVSKSPAIHAHTHEHDGTRHTHVHFHWGDAGHAHEHRLLRWGGRPFVVGIVHGLAGTAAVMLLVVGAIPSLLLALGTLLIFGAGSIGGMMAVSVLLSVPLTLAAGQVRMMDRAVRLLAGAFSLGFGLFLTWQVGFLQALR